MTIPKTAWPVVEEIRKHVLKPKELPTLESQVLVWIGNGDFGRGSKCPLGLLPYALAGCPNALFHFSPDCPFDLSRAEVFWNWWDAQEDAEEAVAEVWEKTLSE